METVILRVDSIGYGGAGVARLDGRVVFVPFTSPGEVVRARIVEERRTFLSAEIVEILEPGPLRRQPRCRHFGECGGCTWQHVTYPAQLAAKEASLRESVRRIGGIEPPIASIIPAPSEWGYRSRTRLKVGADGVLGYFAAHSNRIVAIEECPILDGSLEQLLPSLRAQYGAGSQVGPSDTGGSREVRGPAGRRRGGRHPATAQPASTGVRYSELLLELSESGRVRTALQESHGEEPGTLGFAQANREVNLLLQELVATEARAGTEALRMILDLYCGDGNLSLPLAVDGVRVVGIDSSESSIRRARSRANELGAASADYRCGEIDLSRSELLTLSKRADCLILDPPRRGLAALAGFIASLKAPKVIYVSCAPPTLARDLRTFVAAGYEVERLQPLDMFPQSYHLETVATLKRRTAKEAY